MPHPTQNPRAKKRLGQHFFKEEKIPQEVVQLLDTSSDTAVIEIGPGRGALTQWLMQSVEKDLYLVEVDPEMVAYLQRSYPQLGETLIQQDFIGFPLEKITSGEVALIGNLPYNVASQILLHAISYRQQVTSMVFILQKEVAERLASPPGSRKYGMLSVWTQAFYRLSYAFEIAPEAFDPPPKVTSAVLVMRRYRTTLPCDPKAFFRVVKTAFGQRRKTLSNALAPLGKPKTSIPEALRSLRAEQLDVEDFIRLTQALS